MPNELAFSVPVAVPARRLHLKPIAAACAVLICALPPLAMAQQAGDPAAADGQPVTPTVVVSGIRTGIEAAISIKKNATSIVEAISAEDIGKLPDNSVAESISRLSGVTTQRNKTTGAATSVSVRGLSPSFNGSLLNGREQASTSDSRSPEFDLFPSELTGSVLVYKTPDATLMGQGLASTIDLRTLKPLEFGSRVLAASARKERIGFGSGSDLGEGHRGTLTYVDQFANRTIGVAIGLTSFKQNNGGELRFDNWGGTPATLDYQGASVSAPGGFMSETSRRKSDRDGASVTLQFRPNARFKTTLDTFYSRGTESTKKTGIEGSVSGSTGLYDPAGVLSNAVIANGVATSGTISNYKGDIRNHVFSNEDKLVSLGWNSELKAGQWRFESDLSHSKGTKQFSNYETIAGQAGNTPDSQISSISYSGYNGQNLKDVKWTPSLDFSDRSVMKLTDVAGWGGGPLTPQAGYLSLPRIDDQVDSLRLGAQRELEWGPVNRMRGGVNVTRRDKSRTGEEGRLSIRNGDGYASATIPGSAVETAGTTGIKVASFDPTGTLGTLYELNKWVDATVLGRDWSVSERVGTAYAMADLDSTLFSIPFTGNIGVQVVHTRQSATGNQIDLAKCVGITTDTCPFTVTGGGTSYTNVLPSLNLNFDLGSDQMLRVGAGKQISRPNLDQMRASKNFGLPATTAVDPALSGFAGNPELKPWSARSFDLSYEKYFGKKAYVSAAAFFKQLDTYVINAPRLYDFAPHISPTTPLPATGQFAGSTMGFLTKPENGEGGNMHGFEVSANMPFSLLTPVLDGFGVSANYSFTDSSVRLPTSGFVSPTNSPVFANQVSEIGLPGLSKHVSSVRVYYENRGWQLAWAAYRRSSFVGAIQDYRGDAQFTYVKGETISDVRASYEFGAGALKGFSVFVQGHNLTNQPFQEYTNNPDLITNTNIYGKTYSAGVNYKF